jgi:hypothetical protein
LAGYYNAFIIRIWYDETGTLQRGLIQHIASQEQAYFQKLEDITAYILVHSSRPRTNGTRPLPPGGFFNSP